MQGRAKLSWSPHQESAINVCTTYVHKYVRKKWDTFSRHGLDSIKIHIFVLFEEHSMARADLNKLKKGFRFRVGKSLVFQFNMKGHALLSLRSYLFLRSLPLCGAKRASSIQNKYISKEKKLIDSALILVTKPRMKDKDLNRK